MMRQRQDGVDAVGVASRGRQTAAAAGGQRRRRGRGRDVAPAAALSAAQLRRRRCRRSSRGTATRAAVGTRRGVHATPGRDVVSPDSAGLGRRAGAVYWTRVDGRRRAVETSSHRARRRRCPLKQADRNFCSICAIVFSKFHGFCKQTSKRD